MIKYKTFQRAALLTFTLTFPSIVFCTNGTQMVSQQTQRAGIFELPPELLNLILEMLNQDSPDEASKNITNLKMACTTFLNFVRANPRVLRFSMSGQQPTQIPFSQWLTNLPDKKKRSHRNVRNQQRYF